MVRKSSKRNLRRRKRNPIRSGLKKIGPDVEKMVKQYLFGTTKQNKAAVVIQTQVRKVLAVLKALNKVQRLRNPRPYGRYARNLNRKAMQMSYLRHRAWRRRVMS